MILNKANLVLIACAQEHDDDDPTNPLASLRVEPDGTTVATNGHVLARADPAPLAIPACAPLPRTAGKVPREAIRKILAAMPAKGDNDGRVFAAACVEHLDADAFTLATSPDGSQVVRIDGACDAQREFPNWPVVMPRHRQPHRVRLGARYLALIAQTAVKAGVDWFDVAVDTDQPSAGVVFAGTVLGQRVTFVLMPMRSEEPKKKATNRPKRVATVGDATVAR